MSIRKDVTVKITNNNATLDMPLQIYELDHGIELRFKLMDYKYKYTKDPQNILNSSDEDILEAYTTIINPRGYELQQINGEVKDDIVVFMIDSSYTDEIDEVGIYSLQIHIKCACSEFSIPPIQFEVLQRLKGIKVVTDGEDSIDDSALIDNYSNFISDETGKLLIEWKKGDIISSVKLNAMVEVINNAVDEEVQRQANEVKREQQELERQNKVREALNSVDARVDEAMNEYETRFNALTVSQQQDMEVIDARDGEISLKARLDRDVRNPLQVYEDVEGSYISCDSTEGYTQNVEILGNTIQNQNDLADIRSVGDKIEGQELYEIPVLIRGKNLLKKIELGTLSSTSNGSMVNTNSAFRSDFIRVEGGKKYTISIYTDDIMFSSVYLYDKNYSYITYGKLSDPLDDNCRYIKIVGRHRTNGTDLTNMIKDIKIQLEEGTVVTEYEPYQEQQITILSPTPLEKIGDVADRIVEKDGAWGVEKNVKTLYLGKDILFDTGVNVDNDNYYGLYTANSVLTKLTLDDVIINIPKVKWSDGFRDNPSMAYWQHTTASVGVVLPKNILSSYNVNTFNLKLVELGISMKIPTAQPQFIPLPYDQQVKLRTFANKTNISFGCEIEPTLKAQVPKSLGASISSHSEQIDNLSKELEKINNLEESVTSEVISESDFTCVEQTSNGYFEDVKLEGKTLVNLFNVSECTNYSNYILESNETLDISKLKPDTIYTGILFDNTNKILYTSIITKNGAVSLFSNMYNKIFTFKTPQDLSSMKEQIFKLYSYADSKTKPLVDTDVNKINFILLEGDHTQNPPEYFEGLKSVGQDVDEISVLSQWANGNLFDGELEYGYYHISTGLPVNSKDSVRNVNMINVKPGSIITVHNNYSYTNYIYQYDKNKNFLFYKVTNTIQLDDDCHYINFRSSVENKQNDLKVNYIVNYGDVTLNDIRKQDKKQILYYNDETQTWEKPVLRQWDSIEKHSDGKYYYHKRSDEVVLDGSEDWIDRSATYVSDTQTRFSIEHSVKPCSIGTISLICDKYPVVGAIPAVTTVYENGINHHITGSTIYITVPKTTLENFRPSLQANPVTVVYQLAEEKVYECTDLDLITYQNETNLMVKGGVIVPKTTLKVHQNITNITTILQEKVSVLENNVGHVTEIFVDSKIEPINREIGNINTDLTSLAESIEGSCISVDSKDGYLKDIEILGNTIQNQNDLADIRSVGDKLENQELYEIPVLSTGKNLFDGKLESGQYTNAEGKPGTSSINVRCVNFIRVKNDTDFFLSVSKNMLQIMLYEYDNNYNFVKYTANINGKSFRTSQNTSYIKFALYNNENLNNVNMNIQLEEGTVATPYQPYSEQQITILSPVQLEKVGDVADRIICKDGVWGVEKNIENVTFDGSEVWQYNANSDDNLTNTIRLNTKLKTVGIETVSIMKNFKFLVKTSVDEEGHAIKNVGVNAYIRINKTRLSTADVSGFKQYLNSNPVTIYYQTTQPTFIPLPYDQQIKLRTFANKTNIHFLTEIEPTLKASVPKSIGATVNTHTEQIDNLGKELDKVKKLEESTVSTVTTESDFTTVTETSNGYFEDVKLEGKTLVNLASLDKTVISHNIQSTASKYIDYVLKNKQYTIDKNKEYTFIINVSKCPNDRPVHANKFGAVADMAFAAKPLGTGVGTYIYKSKPKQTMELSNSSNFLTIGCDVGSLGDFECSVIILEGDHTQNPPEYFEGLKSVGQDVDEISVLSCNENLFDVKSVIEKYPNKITPFGNGLSIIHSEYDLTYLIPNVNKQYTISWHGEPVEQSANQAFIGFVFNYTDGTNSYSIGKGDMILSSIKGKTIASFAISYSSACTMNLTNISLVQGDTPKPYQPHKQDKKPLLYYNPTTDTWEKPILKEWDSIEKHSDGKYYYHKRSGEVVLNSSDDWKARTDVADDGVHIMFSLLTSCEYDKSSYMICDRYNPMPFVSAAQAYGNGEGFSYYAAKADSRHIFYYVLPKSKLSSQDEAGFKAWLQSNPTTIVYQLEKEEVYECTSIDLMTYENETNYIVTAGAIAPVSTLKVMCNINNVVRELQQKVSNLENYIQHVMIDALNNALNE